MMNYPYPNNQYAEAYRYAERRVRARVRFFWHLAIYLMVNAFLFAIYLVDSLALNWFGYPWFLWPLGVWGFLLMLRFLRVFVFPDSPAYREQMIARELERINYPLYPAQPPVTTTNHHNTYEEPIGSKETRERGQ
ncbi:MAG: 2TM domain-containing protein [Chloroflexi bacterium]|nr:2TM domain-containing protein [Chloroflexota bacterium]OJV90232.1 MAG: hypothetical protein BGO39_02420 [Chloroflexi bacterium 54-19]